ncbi:Probable arsenic-transport integral membrane protein ArsC [Mycobacteroides abscessus]|nr:Probable arsenic-transport integral membrane protein ArsC [Mycobacteroides abscessus]
MSQATAARNADTTVGKLSTLDRYLPLWIGLAMAAGLLLGRNVPGLNSALEKVQVDGISLPIAVSLLIMMYPVLAKVRYDRLGSVAADRRLLAGSLVLNWVLGPALMFTLAWLLLPDLPEYRTGLIIVGLARCIAMVIIWNDLACGDREAAAVLVALNSLFQVLTFAALGWFYLSLLPGWLHLPQTTITASPWEIAKSVLIFLGIPLMAGYLSRRFGEKVKGRGWYESKFLPAISPWALYGLLFTIVILFALQGAKSPPIPGTWHESRCRCWPISPSCGAGDTCSAPPSVSGMRVPPRWRLPPRETTSSWRSRWPSPPMVRPPVKLWPVWWGPSSRCRS